MKKFVIIYALVILASLAVTSNIMAVPFIEVEGISSFKGGNDNLDGTTTFSQVDYLFRVTDAGDGAGMNYLKLEFENDVFVNPVILSNYDPSDWFTYDEYDSTSSYNIISTAGTAVGLGESLSFSVMNATIYTEALTNADFWQEGQIWAQSWDALGTNPVGFFPTTDGGSTSPVPEPGTLALLGSGLIGVVLYTRKKKCLLSI